MIIHIKKPVGCSNIRTIVLYSAVAIGLLAPINSFAQSNEVILEEVIVTANKRDAVSAQDTGISLSAITGDTIEREGYDTFADYARTVAGLSFGERGPGQSLIIIRGVNSSTTQFNTDEPESKETVGVYFDETPVALNGYNPNPRLFDIERIEVLRGPQGTLFGSGSLSGTIRYISKKPRVDNFEAVTGATFSTTEHGGNNIEVNGLVNLPLSDTSAVRVAGFSRNIDGFIDNVAIDTDPRHPLAGQGALFNADRFENVNTDDTWGFRAQYLKEFNDNFDLIARVYHQESDFGGYPTEDTFAQSEPLPGNDPDNATLSEYQQSRLVDEISTDEFTLYNIETHYDLGFAKLTTVTSYVEREFVQDFEFTDIIPTLLEIPVRQFPAPALLNNVTEVEDVILEVRLASSAKSKFNWLIGAFYDSQEKTYLQSGPVVNLTTTLATFGLPDLQTVFGSSAPGIPDNVFESRSEFDETQLAVFAEVSWDVSDRWRLIAGARWFDFDQDFFFGDTRGAFSSGLTINNNLSEDGVNPKFSVEYRPSEDLLFYGTASKGFRLGGNNDPVPTQLCGVSNSDLAFESDSLWSYELGAKASFNNRIQLNGSVYQIDWSDIPVADSMPCGFAVTRNVGEVEVSGFEADITFAITESLQVSGNFSYVKSEFTQAFAPLDIVDGTETPLVPEFTANANAVYRFPLGGAEGYLSGSYSYRDERFNTANPTERVAMDSYSLVNFRFGIESERWQASLFVENALDKRAVILKDTIFLQENRDTVNRPRTVGISLLARF